MPPGLIALTQALSDAAIGEHLGQVQQRRVDRPADRETSLARTTTDTRERQGLGIPWAALFRS